ncbi:MAG: ribosome silencing factor [Blastocatellia bacterium]|jgi:ribosome-associated protein|nr:ribosome silencing factor [Blastocatellia bacterium]MBK6427238.1 ribosome silencing factor [Blastocatellia bacterium]
MSTNDPIRDDAPAEINDLEKLMLAAEAAASRKALQMTAIDIRKIASFAEFFLVCSGTSTRQVQAIADEVMDRLKKERNSRPLHTEGFEAGTWVLLDYGDLIVHVFTEEAREFYQLERLWRDADRVALPAAMTAE